MRMKILRKIAVFALALSLALPATATMYNAAGHAATAEAKSPAPKISKRTLTISQGRSKQLKVNNCKKKVKWTSSNKKVATVNKKGWVTAKSPGKAFIYAKAGGKKMKCAVTVNFSEKKAKQNIDIAYEQGERNTIAYFYNGNQYAISVQSTMAMYANDDPGRLLDTDYDSNYCIGPGETAILEFDNPKVDGERIIPKNYKLTYSISQSYHKSYAKKISTTYDITGSGVIVTAQNDSGKKLSTIGLKCLMYDENGALIDVSEKGAYCNDPGSTDYVTFSFPLDATYDPVTPARCVVYVDHAYIYN